eukprot:jgi/Ulvmu1/389/UM001_0396.1
MHRDEARCWFAPLPTTLPAAQLQLQSDVAHHRPSVSLAFGGIPLEADNRGSRPPKSEFCHRKSASCGIPLLHSNCGSCDAADIKFECRVVRHCVRMAQSTCGDNSTGLLHTCT